MPDDIRSATYQLARQARDPRKRSPVLPPSKGESVNPDFLLHHENHADANVVTPEQLMDKGSLRGKLDPLQTT
jgi:hypothetical protein